MPDNDQSKKVEPGAIFDIQRPQHRAADPTSRPIIGHHEPIQPDPMVVEPKTQPPLLAGPPVHKAIASKSIDELLEEEAAANKSGGGPQEGPIDDDVASDADADKWVSSEDPESEPSDSVEYVDPNDFHGGVESRPTLDISDDSKADGIEHDEDSEDLTKDSADEPVPLGADPTVVEEDLKPIQVTTPKAAEKGVQTKTDDFSGLSASSAAVHTPEEVIKSQSQPVETIANTETTPVAAKPKPNRLVGLLIIIIVILVAVVAALVVILLSKKQISF
jgi:hypothetical protein